MRCSKYFTKENVAAFTYSIMTPLSVADGVLIAEQQWTTALTLLAALSIMEFYACKIYIQAVKRE